jgi:acyl-homoserine-lactone acylase
MPAASTATTAQTADRTPGSCWSGADGGLGLFQSVAVATLPCSGQTIPSGSASDDFGKLSAAAAEFELADGRHFLRTIPTLAPRLFHGRRLFEAGALLLLALTIAACATSPTPPATQRYDVEVVRTEFGIPHVTAADPGSLGYGIGYAYAQDNFCMLAEKINQLSGERSRYFGPDTPAYVGVNQMVSSRISDFFHKSQFSRDAIAAEYRQGSSESVKLTRGYAAGINRYLHERGVENLPAACRGAAWVRPVTEEDLYLWYTMVATQAATQAMAEAIVAAQPPAPREARLKAFDAAAGSADPLVAAETMAASLAFELGSNAWAFGREATVNGRGLLFGNPHWSWGNMNQFYQAHLTIPGSLDVMGVTYGGMPAVVLGFNRSVAWSHTVSTGSRFILRELSLAPDSSTVYLFDGEPRAMQVATITIDVRGEDGSISQESRRFYSTHLGPVIVRTGVPWTESAAYVLTDVNLPNRRMVEQWLQIARATNVEQVRVSLASTLGVPWVNTVAADVEGGALYTDYSVKPFVTDEMLEECGGSPLARRLTQNGVVTLDGSRRGCDPRSDPEAPQPGILPARLLPVLSRADYVANSNNSYWLTNPRAPLNGLSRINGPADSFIGFRPQSGLRIIEARLAGSDGLPGVRFDAQMIKALVFGLPGHDGHGNHNRAGEVMLGTIRTLCDDDPVVTMTDGSAVDLTAACQVLARWDMRHATSSVGAHLFREFWTEASRIPRLWSIPFDAGNPLETPREADVANPEIRAALRHSLGSAVARLGKHGIALERPWGEVHGHQIGDRYFPLAGNHPNDVLNMMITARTNAEGYRQIVHGASYVQIVGFDDEGPVADAVLLFGQSTDPASPFYYDQLERLWTREEWHRLPFTPEAIAASVVSRIRLQE